jgi:DNA processing protein
MTACDDCLRRSNLIAALAPRIEGLLQRPDRRIGEVLALPDDDLLSALVPTERLADLSRAIAVFEPDDARIRAAEAEAAVVCRHDSSYPAELRLVADAPPVLWARGDVDRMMELLASPCVAIVGSRRPSAYGEEVAEELGRGLAAAGVTVISGMAMGIDAAAHRGALRADDRRTVAVLGCGVDIVYPRVNQRLHEQITEAGIVMSEIPPGRRPYRWTFPARNRIMAALSAMTVVVEAGEPSGSLITASFAADLGRGVCAVPGRVTASTAAGSNRLLRDGAAVIRHAADALDELFGIGGAQRMPVKDPREALEPRERAVLEAVENGADPGTIAAATGLDPARVRTALGSLEAAGLIERSGIGSYERCATRHP